MKQKMRAHSQQDRKVNNNKWYHFWITNIKYQIIRCKKYLALKVLDLLHTFRISKTSSNITSILNPILLTKFPLLTCFSKRNKSLIKILQKVKSKLSATRSTRMAKLNSIWQDPVRDACWSPTWLNLSDLPLRNRL